MSLAHDYHRQAIERRQRMNAAALQRRASELTIKLVKTEPVTPPTYAIPDRNRIPDELLNCRPYVQKYPPVMELVNAVSVRFGVPVKDILSERRSSEIIHARHACFWLIRQVTPMSLLRIAHFMGKKDHSTVINGVEATEKRIATNFPEEVAQNCLILRDLFNGPTLKPYWGA